jgi:hypothetical protein
MLKVVSIDWGLIGTNTRNCMKKSMDVIEKDT